MSARADLLQRSARASLKMLADECPQAELGDAVIALCALIMASTYLAYSGPAPRPPFCELAARVVAYAEAMVKS